MNNDVKERVAELVNKRMQIFVESQQRNVTILRDNVRSELERNQRLTSENLAMRAELLHEQRRRDDERMNVHGIGVMTGPVQLTQAEKAELLPARVNLMTLGEVVIADAMYKGVDVKNSKALDSFLGVGEE